MKIETKEKRLTINIKKDEIRIIALDKKTNNNIVIVYYDFEEFDKFLSELLEIIKEGEEGYKEESEVEGGDNDDTGGNKDGEGEGGKGKGGKKQLNK